MAELQERQRILESVQEKIFREGFVKVTVDEMADDLGMSKKTIYKIFPSKEEIMRGIVHMTMRRIEKQVTAIVDSDKPFEQKFTEFLAILARLTSKFSKQLQRDIQKYLPQLEKEMEVFRREKIFGKLRPMFHQAKEEGFLREDLNDEVFMLVFINSVQNIMTPSVLADQSFSAQEAFRQIFQILFEGALTEEARKKFHFFDFSTLDDQARGTL
ncbi:MAG: TetR/AcrR family transcriptional regulator [Ignavibacteriales bacterium]|nr:TetR/AcrR family transcriptional regulator [Ignavibacteriales bacterium]